MSLLRLSIASTLIILLGDGGARSAPRVAVKNIRRAFHNGEHNAFTDMVRFRDRYYLTFRSCPDGHGVHPTASIIVLTSADGSEWKQVHQFRVARRDTRDPHFLAFGDRLFVYTGTWYCGETSPTERDMNRHLGYAVWTADGKDWHGPAMLEGTYGHYVWRAATHGGKAYLCGRRIREFAETASRAERDPLVESALLVSDDGLVYKTQGLFQEKSGNETAFLFEPDGSILAVARGGGDRRAQVCRSKPPFNVWQRTELDRQVGGPLIVKWGKHHLVGGRKTVTAQPKTSLYWLIDDKLEEFAELPSAGDNSYPGFLELSPTRALVSWYSSHEKDEHGKPITAIYLAELEIVDGRD
jgi:hypothetical protein